jgi:uncharacterized protein
VDGVDDGTTGTARTTGTLTAAARDRTELVRELGERFGAGDRDGAFELLHPDLRIQQPESLPHGGWHVGRSGMEKMGATFARYWSRTIRDPRVLGCKDGPGGQDLVVQITTQTWTAHGTGESATVDVVELFSFDVDLVAEIRVFQQDTAALLQTLGPEVVALTHQTHQTHKTNDTEA